MPLRAAIYARYSSENQREASIEDQVRLCRERCDREGWIVVNVYSDSAQSGASRFRRDYAAMFEAARAGGFDVLVSESLDRLSRDQEDTAALYKRMSFFRIPIISLYEGEINELHVGLTGTKNAQFLKDLGRKTHRGLRGRIEQRKSAGGLAYGYRTVPKLGERGELVRGDREIDQAQAAVVLRIFREFVEGRSPRDIAKRLNAEGIPGPTGDTWVDSAIRGHAARRTGILRNQIYIGQLVWNRQQFVKHPDTGKRISRMNQESVWIVKEVPELRILDQALWDRARARHAEATTVMGRDEAGNALNRVHRQTYLLSGLLTCGACGGSYTMIGRNHYGCAAHRYRGTCGNRTTVRRDELEQRVLSGLRERLLTPERIKIFVQEFIAEVNRRTAGTALERAQREVGLKETVRKIDHILAGIEQGIYTPSTKDRLLELEAKKAEIEGWLAITPEPTAPALHPNLAAVYRQRVADLEAALNDPEAKHAASSALRELIEKIVLTPGADGLAIDLHGELGALMALGEKQNAAIAGGVVSVVAGVRCLRGYTVKVAV